MNYSPVNIFQYLFILALACKACRINIDEQCKCSPDPDEPGLLNMECLSKLDDTQLLNVDSLFVPLNSSASGIVLTIENKLFGPLLLRSNEISSATRSLITGLFLKKNRIPGIRAGTFDLLPKLSILYLKQNEMSFVEPHSFDSLRSSLVELKLHANMLTRLEANTVANLTRLTLLYLQENHIESVDKHSFSQLGT